MSSIKVPLPPELKNADVIDELKIELLYANSSRVTITIKDIDVLHTFESIKNKIKIRDKSVTLFGQTFMISLGASSYFNNPRIEIPEEFNEESLQEGLAFINYNLTWNEKQFSKHKSILVERL